MMFKDLLNDFLEFKISVKQFKEKLRSFQTNIWGVGLVEEEIHLCVQIFLECEQLDKDARVQLLHCLVPREKIPEGTVDAFLAWFFSNHTKNESGSKELLSWLSVMLANNLLETKPIERFFNQLLCCLSITELVPSLCNVLRYVVNPETVTPRAVFIATLIFNRPTKFPEKQKISSLLKLFHACSPSLLPNPPSRNPTFTNSVDEFQKAVSFLAFRLGFSSNLPGTMPLGSIHALAVEPKTSKKKDTEKAIQMDDTFMGLVSDLHTSRGMKHLGHMSKRNEIPPIYSATSVIGSKEGQIYVCWQHIIGNKLPPEDKFTVFPVLRKILETCQRMRCGLPAISPLLSRYFISWDIEENQEVIYNLLELIHFESFEDLYAKILCSIVNIFMTGLLMDRINIIDCLTNLIANKVTQVPPEDTIKLIKFVSRLIKIGHASDGLLSSALLLSSLKFYYRISCLEEWYMLGTWTVPPPFLVFGALFSRNHVLISEICALIVRHNVVMYPFYISMGIDDFKEEEEIIKTYLRDLYFFLWKGQASQTELVTDEENLSWISPKEIDSLFTVRSHFGIQPLIAHIISLNELDNSKQMNEKSLLKVIDKYTPGISAVKRSYEGI